MSVVNKMLRDLDARQGSAVQSANYQPPAARRNKAWLALALIPLLALCGWMLWPVASSPAPASESVTPVNVSQPDARPVVRSSQPEAAEVVQVAQPVVDQNQAEQHQSEHSQTYRVAQDDKPSEVTAISGIHAGLPPQEADNRLSQAVAEDGKAVVQTGNADTDTLPPSPVGAISVSKPSQGGNTVAHSLRWQIQQALDDKKPRQAIILLQRLVASEPDNIEVKKKLAALMFAEGQVVAAQQLLTASIAAHPEQDSLRLMLARLLRQQNQPQQALQTLLNGTSEPGLELLGYRASLAQQNGDLPQALSDYHQLVARDQQNAKWWLGLAVVADKLGQSELAFRAYQQASQLNQLGDDVQAFVRERLNLLGGGQS